MRPPDVTRQAAGIANPYVGPRALRHHERLYGRAREVEQLTSLLIASRVVLLFSPSGAGKTSLLRAGGGVVDALRAEEFRVLPLIRVGLPTTGRHANRYIDSTMASLDPARADGDVRRDHKNLSEYLDEAFPDLGDDYFGDVLIFDQFEEILRVEPHDRAAKERFFEEVGMALRKRGRFAIFSMREEFAAAIDRYRGVIPTRLQNTFALEPLGSAAAAQSILEPARAVGVEYEEGAVAALVDDLRTLPANRSGDGATGPLLASTVEPVHLQVTCRQLWRESAVGLDKRRITMADVQAFGSVDRALGAYYDHSVGEAGAHAAGGERTVRDWIDEYLIVDGRQRSQLLVSEAESTLEPAALLSLLDARIVDLEQRRDIAWYELTHDRLLQPILASNRRWLASRLQPWQHRARLWENEERPIGLLLRGRILTSASVWADDHDAELHPYERIYLRESKSEQSRRRRSRAIKIVAAIVALLLIGFGAYAALERQKRIRESSHKLMAYAELEESRHPDRSLLLRALAVRQDPDNTLARNELILALERRQHLPVPYDVANEYGKTLKISSAAWSPTGEWIALGTAKGELFAWRDGTFTSFKDAQLGTLEGRIRALSFDTSGERLIAGTNSGKLAVWHLQERGMVEEQSLPEEFRGSAVGDIVSLAPAVGGHPRLVYSVAGRGLVTKDFGEPMDDGRVVVRDPGIKELAYTSRHRRLAIALSVGIAICDLSESLEHLIEFDSVPCRVVPVDRDTSSVGDAAFDESGRWLAILGRAGAISVLDVDCIRDDDGVDAGRSVHVPLAEISKQPTAGPSNSRCLKRIVTGDNPWKKIGFIPEQRYLLAAGKHGRMQAFFRASGEQGWQPSAVWNFDGHTHGIGALAFGQRGGFISGDEGGVAIRWQLTSRLWHDDAVLALAVDPEHHRFASGSADGAVLLWQRDAGSSSWTSTPLSGPRQNTSITALTFTAHGLAVGVVHQHDARMDLYPIASPGKSDARPGQPSTGHELSHEWRGAAPVSHLVVHPEESSLLISGQTDGSVCRWRLDAWANGGQPGCIEPEGDKPGGVTGLQIDEQGRLLVSHEHRSGFYCRDLQRLDRLISDCTVRDQFDDRHTSALHRHPDGRHIILGFDDGTVAVWDARSRTSSTLPSRHEHQITGIQSISSRLLASVDEGGRLELWDWASRSPIGHTAKSAHDGAIERIAWSDESKELFTAGDDRSIARWNLLSIEEAPDWDELCQRVCRTVTRPLSRSEWRGYVGESTYEPVCLVSDNAPHSCNP